MSLRKTFKTFHFLHPLKMENMYCILILVFLYLFSTEQYVIWVPVCLAIYRENLIQILLSIQIRSTLAICQFVVLALTCSYFNLLLQFLLLSWSLPHCEDKLFLFFPLTEKTIRKLLGTNFCQNNKAKFFKLEIVWKWKKEDFLC